MRKSSIGLGTIPIDRLEQIPLDHWVAHEFCFFLHDKMLEMFLEMHGSGIQDLVFEALAGAAKRKRRKISGDELFDLLRESVSLKDAYKHHLRSQIGLALTSDMLQYFFEALTCFERRKFSVGFSLLRKPLKEHLLHLSWLLGDEDDFLNRFEGDVSATLNRVRPERRVEIVESATIDYRI